MKLTAYRAISPFLVQRTGRRRNGPSAGSPPSQWVWLWDDFCAHPRTEPSGSAEPVLSHPWQTEWNHAAILKLTAEIFPGGEIAVTEEFDPEIPGPEYFVVNVLTSGEIRELVAKDGQWHHRIWEVAPETASSYRLSLGVE